MRDYMYLGEAPFDEDCAQVGRGDYHERSVWECRALVKQMRRICGEEPQGAIIAVRKENHSSGITREVVCYYDEGNEEAEAYAWKCEDEFPQYWDDEAKAELKTKESELELKRRLMDDRCSIS